MAQRISGFSAFPPVETVIDPRIETTIRTSARFVARRRPRSKLSPHFGIAYPPPPASPEVVTRERPRLVAVKIARFSQQRKILSVLRPHVGIVYPSPSAAVVFAPVRVVHARVRIRPKRFFSWRTPPVIGESVTQDALGGIGISLAIMPRPRIPSSFLRPPIVDDE